MYSYKITIPVGQSNTTLTNIVETLSVDALCMAYTRKSIRSDIHIFVVSLNYICDLQKILETLVVPGDPWRYTCTPCRKLFPIKYIARLMANRTWNVDGMPADVLQAAETYNRVQRERTRSKYRQKITGILSWETV